MGTLVVLVGMGSVGRSRHPFRHPDGVPLRYVVSAVGGIRESESPLELLQGAVGSFERPAVGFSLLLSRRSSS